MTDHEEPRRLVNADVIRMQHELALAQATRSGEPYVTVEFTRNAKGDTQINTKVSLPGGWDQEAFDLQCHEALTAATDLYTAAAMRFPTATGTVTNDAPPKGEKA